MPFTWLQQYIHLLYIAVSIKYIIIGKVNCDLINTVLDKICVYFKLNNLYLNVRKSHFILYHQGLKKGSKGGGGSWRFKPLPLDKNPKSYLGVSV